MIWAIREIWLLYLPHFFLLLWVKTGIHRRARIRTHPGAYKHSDVWPIGEWISRGRSQESPFSESLLGNHEAHYRLRTSGCTIHKLKNSSFKISSWMLDCFIMGIMHLISKNTRCPVKFEFRINSVYFVARICLMHYLRLIFFHLTTFHAVESQEVSGSFTSVNTEGSKRILKPRGACGVFGTVLWRVSWSFWGPLY